MSELGSEIPTPGDKKSNFDIDKNEILIRLSNKHFDSPHTSEFTRESILINTIEDFTGQEVQNRFYLQYLMQISLAIFTSVNKNSWLPEFLTIDSAAIDIFPSDFTIKDIKDWMLTTIYFLASKKLMFNAEYGYPSTYSGYSIATLAATSKFIDLLLHNLPESHQFARQLYASWYWISANQQTKELYPKIKIAKPYRMESMIMHGVHIARAATTHHNFLSNHSPKPDDKNDKKENEHTSSSHKKNNSSEETAQNRDNGLKDLLQQKESLEPEIYAYQYLQFAFGHCLARMDSLPDSKQHKENKIILEEIKSSLSYFLENSIPLKTKEIIDTFLKEHINEENFKSIAAPEIHKILDILLTKINEHLEKLYKETHYQEDRFFICPQDNILPPLLRERAHVNTAKIFASKNFQSGTTGCVVGLNKNEITVANIGDSRAVLFSRKKRGGTFKAYILTIDQEPGIEKSVQLTRLLRNPNNVNKPIKYISQNYVHYNTSAQGNMIRGLAMTSSIGDDNIVGCHVDTMTYIIHKDAYADYDFILGILTDGTFVGNSMQNLCSAFVDDLQKTAENIINFAYQHGSIDNALVLAISLTGEESLLLGGFDGHSGMTASSRVSESYATVYQIESLKLVPNIEPDPKTTLNQDSKSESEQNTLELAPKPHSNNENHGSKAIKLTPNTDFNQHSPPDSNLKNNVTLKEKNNELICSLEIIRTAHYILNDLLQRHQKFYNLFKRSYGSDACEKLVSELKINIPLDLLPSTPEYKSLQEKIKTHYIQLEALRRSIAANKQEFKMIGIFGEAIQCIALLYTNNPTFSQIQKVFHKFREIQNDIYNMFQLGEELILSFDQKKAQILAGKKGILAAIKALAPTQPKSTPKTQAPEQPFKITVTKIPEDWIVSNPSKSTANTTTVDKTEDNMVSKNSPSKINSPKG